MHPFKKVGSTRQSKSTSIRSNWTRTLSMCMQIWRWPTAKNRCSTNTTFNKGTNINVHNSCHSLTGEYKGNLIYSSKNIYSINILNNTDGSIQLKNPGGSSFTAAWDGTVKLFDKYSIATLGIINNAAYPKFGEEDRAFVTDIGNGIALTVVDEFTGKVSSTAVFIEHK